MREVPVKQLPSTLPAALVEIRKITRDLNTQRRIAIVCEERAIEHATANGVMAAQLAEYIRVINRQRTTIDNQARVIGKVPTMYASALTKLNTARQ